MAEADLALVLTALGGLALRGGGLLLAGVLRPDHPLVAWAAAVSVATLSAFVALAVVAPVGVLATVPAVARLSGFAVGLSVFALAGRRLLPALLAGMGMVALLL